MTLIFIFYLNALTAKITTIIINHIFWEKINKINIMLLINSCNNFVNRCRCHYDTGGSFLTNSLYFFLTIHTHNLLFKV